MRKVSAILAGALSLAFATTAFAQQPQFEAEGIVIKQTRIMQGPQGAPPPPPRDFVFIASESFGGKTVKGAPYSAEAVTETIQILGDGNRIVNRITSTVYRDSEGRTRREQTLKGLGVFGTGDEPLQTIFINDPVGGVTYSLDSRSRIAHKSVPFRLELTSKLGAAAAAENQRFEIKVAPGTAPPTSVVVTAPLGEAPQVEGGGASYVLRKKARAADEVKEQLGKQLIEGVEAEGTRTTITIPAGEIGNERPIQIVSERWYSPELQLVVMTRHSDPRSGETTYKLTNINRSEPAKSLFEVPSDYTVKEGLHPAPIPAPRVRKNPE
jgi:hypothetical protein